MASPNVILLYGNDEYAIKRQLARFESMFGDASSASMNTARLEARSMTEDQLNNAVNAMPFLAKERLVLLFNPSARYTTPEARKKFFEFLQKVPPTARLILTESMELKSSYGSRDRQLKNQAEEEKHWLIKWIKKNELGLQRYALPEQRDMPGWITKQAQEQGGQIDPVAAARLAEMVGPHPQHAAQEIGKLLAFVNWARPVKLEDVLAVSIVAAEADIFAMVDALVQDNGKGAQRMLHKLLEDEDAFAVWPMVVRQFRLLLLAREVIEHGGGVPDVQQALGGHTAEYVAKKAYMQARRFSLPALERIYHRLLEIDEAAKTGRMPLGVAMEMLVSELSA